LDEKAAAVSIPAGLVRIEMDERIDERTHTEPGAERAMLQPD
jgi:hypothetical protein